jgi:hypothetical protein
MRVFHQSLDEPGLHDEYLASHDAHEDARGNTLRAVNVEGLIRVVIRRYLHKSATQLVAH